MIRTKSNKQMNIISPVFKRKKSNKVLKQLLKCWVGHELQRMRLAVTAFSRYFHLCGTMCSLKFYKNRLTPPPPPLPLSLSL